MWLSQAKWWRVAALLGSGLALGGAACGGKTERDHRQAPTGRAGGTGGTGGAVHPAGGSSTGGSSTGGSSTGGSSTGGSSTGGSSTGGSSEAGAGGSGQSAGGDAGGAGTAGATGQQHAGGAGAAGGAGGAGGALVRQPPPLGQLSNAGDHACVIDQLGEVHCWGGSLPAYSGALGNGSREALGDGGWELGTLPGVDLGTGFRASGIVAHAYYQSAALSESGLLKQWGAALGWWEDAAGDAPGELGDALAPVDLAGPIVHFGVDTQSACAVTADGGLYCWGLGAQGVLGTGNEERRDSPGEPIDLGGPPARAVYTGGNHVCALLSDDSVRCWGRNADGELGLGDTEARGDEPGEMGGALPVVDLGAGRVPVALSLVIGSTCALLDSGAVLCWGRSAGGETVGDEPGEMGAELVPLAFHTAAPAIALVNHCALFADGTVECWVDRGTTPQPIALPAGRRPIEIAPSIAEFDAGLQTVCALLDDLTVWCEDANAVRAPSIPLAAPGGECYRPGQLACSAAGPASRLRCEGTAWVSEPECEAGTRCDRTTGTCAPLVSECAAAAPAAVVCEADSLLRCGPDLTSTSLLVECPEACVAGGCQPTTCGDGHVDPGEACDDANDAFDDGCHRCDRVVKLEPYCALTERGLLYCYTDLAPGGEWIEDPTNVFGILPVDLGGQRRVVAFATHSYRACAALADGGGVKCWGAEGALGEAPVPAARREADAVAAAAELLPGVQVSELVMTSSVTCALTEEGSVWCWGLSAQGEAGAGDLADEAAALVPHALPLGGTVASLSAGSQHLCAVLEGGALKCWGDNSFHALGVGGFSDAWRAVGDDPNELGASLPTVDVGTGRTVLKVAAGASATCVVLDDGTVKCWGDGDAGRLASGATERLGLENGGMGDALPIVDFGGLRALELAARRDSEPQFCALLEEGSVKCWGSVGHGDHLGDEPGELGAALPALALGGEATSLSSSASSICAGLSDHTYRCWGSPFLPLDVEIGALDPMADQPFPMPPR